MTTSISVPSSLVIVWLSSAFDFTGAVPFDASARLTQRLANEFSGRDR